MIYITGIGPGSPDFFTEQGRACLAKCQAVFGSSRQLEAARDFLQEKKGIPYKRLTELPLQIETLSRQVEDIAVLASGDPSLFGIGRFLKRALCEGLREQIQILPGISALQYLFAQVAQPMNDVYLTSVHGKEMRVESLLFARTVGFFTDSSCGPWQIARAYREAGEDPWMVIGENLSYPEERIWQGLASQVVNRVYEINCVIAVRGEHDAR